MIDPLLSLAFTVQANKGVYSLLLGSGVSRSAQIPTGWEVVLDLVRKLAHLHGEDCGSAPDKWFQGKFGEEPDYSKLLDELAKTAEERQQLMRGYFEPTAEERDQNLKVPTAAHRAIAMLVAKGYIRVIVTTNFDRLIERAIEDAGVTPTVVSTADAIEGALPIVHQQCVVVKVHGDYLDTRIKNTPAELATYDQRLDQLLDRILDEFGVIMCGWSAQWDIALLAAFDRCKSRRFTLYWAGRGKLTDNAQRLIKHRSGVVVSIADADAFFVELGEKVQALDDIQQPHPLSIAAAEATVKRLLAEDRYRIRLHDLVHEETERAFEALQPIFAGCMGPGKQSERFERFLSEMSSRVELLRTVCVHGAYWGKADHQSLIAMPIQRLAADPEEGRSGVHLNQTLRRIPSIFLLYSLGMAATASKNLNMLVALLATPIVVENGTPTPFIKSIDWPDLQEWFKLLPDYQSKHFPACEWLFVACRSALRKVVPNDADYDQHFDRFEVIRSVVYADMNHSDALIDQTEDIWGPPGRFVWKRGRRGRYGADALEGIENDKELLQSLLQGGRFNQDRLRFNKIVEKFGTAVSKMAQRY